MHLTRKKAIRGQGQSSSKVSFLEVLASSLLGKNCKNPSAYPPTQLFNALFRTGCEGAEAQQHLSFCSLILPCELSSPQSRIWENRLKVTGSLGSLTRTLPHLESFHTFSRTEAQKNKLAMAAQDKHAMGP